MTIRDILITEREKAVETVREIDAMLGVGTTPKQPTTKAAVISAAPAPATAQARTKKPKRVVSEATRAKMRAAHAARRSSKREAQGNGSSASLHIADAE